MNTRTAILPALLGLAWAIPVAYGADTLVPPQGYLEPVNVKQNPKDATCKEPPAPYTGSLQFRSKYEGSGKARATLNTAADEAFKSSTKDITDFERGTSKMVTQFMRDGNPKQLDCALNWMTSWAQANALLSEDFNHTGKSMRKWALGSVSSAYLQLKFSQSHPLAGHEQQTQLIEQWFSKVADEVVKDWDGLPLKKINNHSYWSAWSVMSAAVVTNRRDLFDWAVKEYKIGANQVGPDGFLPNELRRKGRALAYHNYAITPLVMIASFAQANGVDLRNENNGALQRLANNIIAGANDPELFEDKTDEDQVETEQFDRGAKMAWLAPYCTLYTCSPDTVKWKQKLGSMNSFRIGGDVKRVFEPSPAGDKKDHS